MAAEGRRGVVPRDLLALETLSALEVSPDGATLVYGIERADAAQDAYTHDLFLMPSGGGPARRIGKGSTDDTSPRFSADGRRLAWLSDDGDGAQIVVARKDGKGAKRVTSLAEGVLDFDWSPDGRTFVFTRTDPSPDGARGPWVITRKLIQRDGEGFLDERRAHLWVVPAGGGEPRRITSGAYDDREPRFSPDGRLIAFVSNRTEDPDTNDDTDIFVVAPDGSGLRRVARTPGPDDWPRWSHASDRIAFRGAYRANDWFQTRPLMVAPVAGGPVLDLSRDLDTWMAYDIANTYTGSGAIWSPDDRLLYKTFERRAANFLAQVPSDGSGPARELRGGERVTDLVRLTRAGDRLFFTEGSATHLHEIHTVSLDTLAGPDPGRDPGHDGSRRLTRLGEPFLEARQVVAPERVVARNSAGQEVEGFLYPPVEFDRSRRYPLVLYIHGGPEGYDGHFFDASLENQLLPAAGLAVLRCNYAGSTSYGEAFTRRLYGNWHFPEAEDLLACLDEALRTRPWLDGDRLGVGGWSWGGIMSLWLVGHTDRFKVAVPERFSMDYLSALGQDQWFPNYLAELGDPVRDGEKYRRHSPGTYLAEVRTPLYLIANENDGNCPLPQAMQLYQRLRLRGVTTELVVYPGESHSLSKPSHLVDRLERLLRWFGTHLQPQTTR